MRSRTGIFVAIASLLMTSTAQAAECPVTGADATTTAIEKAPTCAAAAAVYEACTWGSSMDVQFGQRVVEKCEAEFRGKLSPAKQRAYKRAQDTCRRKYARRQGTLYLSLAMSCAVTAANSYAKRFGKR